MNKYVLTLAAAALIASPIAAKAEEHAAHADHAAESHAAVTKTLADGTVVSIEGDHAYVVAADGAKTAAPDGTHTFSDGTTATTKDGKVVAE